MTRSLFILLTTFALAACGSKSPPAETTPSPPDEAPATPPPDAMPADHEDHTSVTPDATATRPDPAQVKADLLAAETAAYEQARPVFEKYCASCHQKGGKSATAKKMGHFDMTAYPFGGHHTGEMAETIRKVLGIHGSKPTMPKNKPGSVKGDELALMAAWADAFQASHEGGAHEGMPGHEGHRGHHHKH
jgi:mono/diheme cytochrome c family protein